MEQGPGVKGQERVGASVSALPEIRDTAGAVVDIGATVLAEGESPGVEVEATHGAEAGDADMDGGEGADGSVPSTRTWIRGTPVHTVRITSSRPPKKRRPS
jgi:hypothetical protein